jgi:hypothetical protein
MRFYGLSDEQVLKMPIKRFWLLQRNVSRLAAQEDVRAFNVALLPHGKEEDIKQAYDKWKEQVGLIFDEVTDPAAPAEWDREGYNVLKQMALGLK